eukprot:5271589-Amphidinium_carterae.2
MVAHHHMLFETSQTGRHCPPSLGAAHTNGRVLPAYNKQHSDGRIGARTVSKPPNDSSEVQQKTSGRSWRARELEQHCRFRQDDFDRIPALGHGTVVRLDVESRPKPPPPRSSSTAISFRTTLDVGSQDTNIALLKSTIHSLTLAQPVHEKLHASEAPQHLNYARR